MTEKLANYRHLRLFGDNAAQNKTSMEMFDTLPQNSLREYLIMLNQERLPHQRK